MGQRGRHKEPYHPTWTLHSVDSTMCAAEVQQLLVVWERIVQLPVEQVVFLETPSIAYVPFPLYGLSMDLLQVGERVDILEQELEALVKRLVFHFLPLMRLGLNVPVTNPRRGLCLLTRPSPSHALHP